MDLLGSFLNIEYHLAENSEGFKPGDPLFSLWNHLRTGFTPYHDNNGQDKDNNTLPEDLAAPLVAIGKGLDGAKYFFNSFYHLFFQGESAVNWGAALVYGIFALFEGTVRLAITPVIWLYRIPLRALLSLFASCFGATAPSTALQLSSTLLVAGGMTALAWEGLQHELPSFAHTVSSGITDLLGHHAMTVLSYGTLGLAGVGLLGVVASLCLSDNANPNKPG